MNAIMNEQLSQYTKDYFHIKLWNRIKRKYPSFYSTIIKGSISPNDRNLYNDLETFINNKTKQDLLYLTTNDLFHYEQYASVLSTFKLMYILKRYEKEINEYIKYLEL